jgi:hypothetical protein
VGSTQGPHPSLPAPSDLLGTAAGFLLAIEDCHQLCPYHWCLRSELLPGTPESKRGRLGPGQRVGVEEDTSRGRETD